MFAQSDKGESINMRVAVVAASNADERNKDSGESSQTWIRPKREGDKPRQGAVASTLNSFRNGAIGFIVWLDLFAWLLT
jgi:hypothetical protein